MIILPLNYAEIYPCINSTGATATIYASLDYQQAYKIYRKQFDYEEEKFYEFLKLDNPNCLSPKDVVYIGDSTNHMGYMMNFDSGKAISKITSASLGSLITGALDIEPLLKDLSQHHLLIADPNVDNIMFSDTYKLVDVYSFLLMKKVCPEKLYNRNLVRVNETILCGLIDFSYRVRVINYLNSINSKYASYFVELNRQSPMFVYEALSIIQDETRVETLEQAKTKILLPTQKVD